jgi:hypothetical protein
MDRYVLVLCLSRPFQAAFFARGSSMLHRIAFAVVSEWSQTFVQGKQDPQRFLESSAEALHSDGRLARSRRRSLRRSPWACCLHDLPGPSLCPRLLPVALPSQPSPRSPSLVLPSRTSRSLRSGSRYVPQARKQIPKGVGSQDRLAVHYPHVLARGPTLYGGGRAHPSSVSSFRT